MPILFFVDKFGLDRCGDGLERDAAPRDQVLDVLGGQDLGHTDSSVRG